MNQLKDMIEQTSVKHVKLMRNLSAPLERHFGIHYFCYQYVSNEGDWFTLSNTPDWIQHSAEKQFYKVDPSLVKPTNYASGVSYAQYHPNEQFQETLAKDAVELFNLDHCLALVERCKSGCEYYFFSAPRDHSKILEIYMTQLTHLRRDYIQYVHSEIKPIIQQCLESSVTLKALDPEGFDGCANLLTIEDSLDDGVNFLCDIKKMPVLRYREIQCLMLYQQGLTAKQTARELQLSNRTIEDHFEQIKMKFGVFHKNLLLDESICPRMWLLRQLKE